MPFNSETRINTYATGDQTDVTVTRLSDGSFVDVWTSAGQDGSGKGVYMRHYDASGNSLSAETLVNTTTTNNQYLPTVSSLGNGGFVVGWSSTGQDGSSDGIFLQRFDSNAAAVGTETRANVYTAGSQSASHVASLSDGGYIAVWNSVGQDGAQGGIYARQFNSSGVSVGGEIHVSTTTADNQYQPTVTGLPGGGSVVVWSANGQDGSDLGVFMQRFDSAGHAVGAETQVNTYTSLNQFDPSVVALNDGGFLVTWDSHAQDSSFYGVYGQRYDASGVATGAEFRVSGTTAYGQQISSAAAMPDGGFVMTWQSGHQDGSGWGIYAERFDAAGHAVGGEVLVNHTITGDQVKPHVAAIDADHYVVTWTGPDGDGTGVFQNVIGTTGTTGPGVDVDDGHSALGLGYYRANLAGLADGGFVMGMWQPSEISADGVHINNASFAIIDEAGHVQTIQSVDHRGFDTNIAALSNGGFVETWVIYAPGSSDNGTGMAQVFHADGTAQTGAFQVSYPAGSYAAVVDTGSNQFAEVHANSSGNIVGTIRSDVTGGVVSSFDVADTGLTVEALSTQKLSDGFAVAWDDPAGIVSYQIFNNDGTARTAMEQAPTNIYPGAATPLATTAISGGFAIEYLEGDSSGNAYLRIQTVSNNGALLANFVVPGNLGIINYAGANMGIGTNAEGHLIVSWFDGPSGDVHAREYLIDGTAVGGDTLVHGNDGNALMASTTLANGQVVTTWDATGPGVVEWSYLG